MLWFEESAGMSIGEGANVASSIVQSAYFLRLEKQPVTFFQALFTLLSFFFGTAVNETEVVDDFFRFDKNLNAILSIVD
jgi:hypothetical protein